MIEEVFRRFCTDKNRISSDRFREALESMGICVDEEEALEFVRSKGGDVGFVDSAEFQRAVGRQWSAEVWAKSLPLAEMLADALPNCIGCHRLRAVSDLKEEEIAAIADGYRDGLVQVLNEHIAMLRNAYKVMAVYATKSKTGLAAKKFEVSSMSSGKIGDFHDGLQKRIGVLVIGDMGKGWKEQ